jgi:hypothetical protein
VEKGGLSRSLKDAANSHFRTFRTAGMNPSARTEVFSTDSQESQSSREAGMEKMKMCILAGIILILWVTTALGADPPGMGPANPLGK